MWKRDELKIVADILGFVSMLFFDIWKIDEQKIAPGFIGFVSMLF